jgi:dTDP-4-dehydrorhamnose 3,5-epimerase-like enzyme
MNKVNGEGPEEPRLIEGALSVDDRGEVGFVNGFAMDGIKRFYTVSNHRSGFVRAWHAHRREAKYVTVISGAALIAVVKIDDWERPLKDQRVFRFVLSDKKPSVVFIPAGFANGFMNLTKKTKLMYFSTATIEESKGDDVRFDARYWDPWQVEER